MLFDGPELQEVLGRSGDEIELRNEYGRRTRILSRDEALALDPGLFVGIGNRRRIRFLRPLTHRWALNAGSRTTQRLTDGQGVYIAHPLIREHKAIRGAGV
jgi:hypothetical protein